MLPPLTLLWCSACYVLAVCFTLKLGSLYLICCAAWFPKEEITSYHAKHSIITLIFTLLMHININTLHYAITFTSFNIQYEWSKCKLIQTGLMQFESMHIITHYYKQANNELHIDSNSV